LDFAWKIPSINKQAAGDKTASPPMKSPHYSETLLNLKRNFPFDRRRLIAKIAPIIFT
jgi:hypothetical protein